MLARENWQLVCYQWYIIRGSHSRNPKWGRFYFTYQFQASRIVVLINRPFRPIFGKVSKMALFHKELWRQLHPTLPILPNSSVSQLTAGPTGPTLPAHFPRAPYEEKEEKKVKCKVKWQILEAYKKEPNWKHSQLGQGAPTRPLSPGRLENPRSSISMKSRIANSRKSHRHRCFFPISNICKNPRTLETNRSCSNSN